jgi:hypothetical protein
VRTTLTLDDDVHKKLEAEARRTGRPFKEVVNEHLRRSLASSGQRKTVPPFRVDARPMDLMPGIDLSDIEGLLDRLDGAATR